MIELSTIVWIYFIGVVTTLTIFSFLFGIGFFDYFYWETEEILQAAIFLTFLWPLIIILIIISSPFVGIYYGANKLRKIREKNLKGKGKI